MNSPLRWTLAAVGVGAAAFALAVVITGRTTTSASQTPLWTNGMFAAQTQHVDLTILPVIPARGLVDDRVVEPNFAVQPGVPVTIAVTNYTTVVHTFTVPGLGVSFAVKPGAKGSPVTTTFTFTPNKRGAFAWHCAHCLGHMTGTIYAIVGATSRAAAA